MNRQSVFVAFLTMVGVLTVLFAGVAAGVAVLPTAAEHQRQGPVPDEFALRVDVDPRVRARIATTDTLGGTPRYSYTMVGVAEPAAELLVGRELRADCVLPGWAAALGQRCSGELLVVVAPGRPVRLYYTDAGILPEVDADVFLEESHPQ